MPAFVVNTYRDEHLLDACLSSIATHHPSDPVIVLPDEPRLKLPCFAGAWSARYLGQLLDSSNDVLVKIDPDQVVVGKIEPPDGDVCGHHHLLSDGYMLIFGYCIAFSRGAAREILESGLLNDPQYKGERFSYRRYPGEPHVSLQDIIVADVARRLGLRTVDWHPATKGDRGERWLK